MGSTCTSVIIYISLSISLLLLISRSSNNSSPHRHRHRRLKLRSNFTFDQKHHTPFDPLVAELERKLQDKHHAAPGAERQPEWGEGEDMEEEEFLNDEEKFNVTSRIEVLFPKIDVAPADGFVSEEELTRWNMEMAQREVLHRTRREMEVHDKDRDGFVSFFEYEPPSWVKKSGQSAALYCIVMIG